MFAAQQVQYNRMYGGLDAAAGRCDDFELIVSEGNISEG